MKRKRFLSLLLTAALVLTFLPITVSAAQGSDFSVTGGTPGTDYTYGADGVLTFAQSGTYAVSMAEPGATTTTDRIVVASGVTVNITLNDISIDLPLGGGCAFELQGTAVVALTLADGTSSSLTSRAPYAGLQVPENAALTIGGSGSLTATGIYDGSIGQGAGIGGGNNQIGGSVTITGGTVEAKGGYSAGIGGGLGGKGGTVSISGGTVTATGSNGAGIGGSGSGSGGTVNISGGTVTATGSNGAGIGGGSGGIGGSVTITGGTVVATSTLGTGIGGGMLGDGGTVNISGGKVTAASIKYAGIGGGEYGRGGTVIITGGTVTATSKLGVGIGGAIAGTTVIAGGSVNASGNGYDILDTPTNGAENGSQPVSLTEATIPGALSGTEVVGLTIPSASYYGTDDLYTDADGKLYLYLPAGAEVAQARTADTVYNNVSSSLIADADAPTVTGVTPAGTGADSGGSVAVTFDEEMRTGAGAVSLDGGTTPLTGGHWNTEKTVFTVPYSGLAYGTVYTVSISGFADYSGNVMTPDTGHGFTTAVSNDATLYGLGLSVGTLSPAFAGGTYAYTASVANSVSGLTVTPTTSHANATVTVNGTSVTSGAVSGNIALSVGANIITVDVTAQDGTTTRTYTVTVTRTASGGGGGSSAQSYKATVSGGGTLNVTVDKAPGSVSVTVSDILGTGIRNGGNETVTMPSIPGVTSYSLGIPVAYLSTPGGGTLTFNTDTGSMTLPADMLAGIAGAEGKKAGITIGLGDKSGLSDAEKAAIGDRPLIEISLTLDGVQTDWNNPGAPVTISIPYEPIPEELLNPDAIVIWYIDGSGNPVCIPNGHYDPVTGMVTFSTTHFSDYAVAYNPVSFNDMAAGAWFHDAVSFIAARDITSGTGGGNFSPGAKLSRGEFIVLLMRAYGIEPDTNSTDNFSDAGNTYYTGYLAAAKRLGISAGVGNNLFAPEKEITRQEMFTLLYNALKVIGQLPQGDSDKTLSNFSDVGQIGAWAKEAVTLLVKTGTVGGSNGKLTPQGTTTRAEMAQVLYNLLGK